MSTAGSGSLSAPGGEGNYSPVMASWEEAQQNQAPHPSQGGKIASPREASDAAPSDAWRDEKLQTQLFPSLSQPWSCCGLYKDSCA